jgi:hypothetical protein
MDTLRSCLPASHDKSHRKLYAAWTDTTMAMSPYKRCLQMQRSPSFSLLQYASLPLYPAQGTRAMSRPQEKGEDIHNEEVGISGVTNPRLDSLISAPSLAVCRRGSSQTPVQRFLVPAMIAPRTSAVS